MPEHPALSKLSRPRLPIVLNRTRLFKSLDRASLQPAVWVAAAPGAGKTTLIASYLAAGIRPCLWYQLDRGDDDPATFFHFLGMASRATSPGSEPPLLQFTSENLAGIEVFARRFFEGLFSRLATSTAVVFDNYHELPAESPLHAIMQIGLSIVPDGVTVYIMSRNPPPSNLASLQVAQTLAVINDDALRLTLSELKQITVLQLRERATHLSNDELKLLYQKTAGWMAGVLLTLQQYTVNAGAESTLDASSTELLFDYLATEILQKLDARTITVLLKTSVLPSVSVSAACKLTGMQDADEILERLYQSRYFVERRVATEPVYQYHPLFGEFLRMQAQKRLSVKDLTWLRREGAKAMEHSGQIDAAFELYRQTGRGTELQRLILANAPTLLGEGRAATLARWIATLPNDLVATTPWLLYWRATCRLPVEPSHARSDFEVVFRQLQCSGDMDGTLLAWCGVINAIAYEWTRVSDMDQWIDRFFEIRSEASSGLSSEVEAEVVCSMLFALFWRRPRFEVIFPWAQKMLAILEALPALSPRFSGPTIALINYCVLIGKLTDAEHVVRIIDESAKQQPGSAMIELTLYQAKGVLAAALGNADECVQLARDGLALAASTGVPFLNVSLLGLGCCGATAQGDLKTAQSFVDQMLALSTQGALVFHSWALAQQAWVALAEGDIPRAHQAAMSSFQMSSSEGPLPDTVSRLALAQTLQRAGKFEEAESHRAGMRRFADETQGVHVEMSWRLLAADAAFDANQNDLALEHLAVAFRIGANTGLLGSQGQLPPEPTARLCAKALEAGIEIDYVKTLIRKRRLQPEPSSLDIDAWPWPVKIFTLGRFNLLRENSPIEFTGKAQKRPLDLLKLLIALGGRDISLHRVLASLWPDADGDAASAALNMALKRLRELLGRPDAIRLTAGKLTINPQLCWVDAWAFQRRLDHARIDVTQIERALELYHGPFLGTDEPDWSLSLRERLRTKFLRATQTLGGEFESKDQVKRASDLYEHAIEVDDTVEEFYRLLMLTHEKLGQCNEAMAVYHRCAAALAKHSGVKPGTQTQTIYRRLRKAASISPTR